LIQINSGRSDIGSSLRLGRLQSAGRD